MNAITCFTRAYLPLILRLAQAPRKFRAAHPGTAVLSEVIVFVVAAGSLCEWPSLGTWLLIMWPPFWHHPAVARVLMLAVFAAASVWSIFTIPEAKD